MSLLIHCSHPIAWPAGKPRMHEPDRQYGRFHRVRDGYHKRDMTLHEARVRVSRAVQAFSGAYSSIYAITPEACEIRTMFPARLDGGFMENRSRPSDPGAVLVFNWKERDMVMAIDRYTMTEQNMCAIAACLDALRAIDRHDGGTLDQAMSGFAALPAPSTRRHWRDVFGGTDSTDLAAIKIVFRKLAKKYHPDASGDPNDSRMADLNLAWADAQAELA